MSSPAPIGSAAPMSGSGPIGSAAPRDPLAQDLPRRPQDLGLDMRRLRRLRRIVFAILALPILMLSLLIVRFVSMPITQAWALGAYSDADYAAVGERLGPVETLNWFEPYLPHLTRGTARLQAGDAAGAEAELRTALDTWEGSHDLNQPAHAECKIRNNLAIAIERQADAIEDPSARGDRLFEAEKILAPCANGGGGGDGDGSGSQGTGNEDGGTTGENGERVGDKRKKADEEAGREPRDASDGDNQAPPDEQEDPDNAPKHEDPQGTQPPEEAPSQGPGTGDQRQDELEQRNKEANGGAGDESDGGPQGRPDKPW